MAQYRIHWVKHEGWDMIVANSELEAFEKFRKKRPDAHIFQDGMSYEEYTKGVV